MSESINQPVDSYSTDPIQLAPWKTWAVSELIRQGLIGKVNDQIENTSCIDGLSEKNQLIFQSTDLNDSTEKLAMVWNLTDFARQIKELKKAFPDNFLHTIATKANPLERILECARDNGAGAEAASIGELKMALKVHSPQNIVFDCPVKTVDEIRFCIEHGVGLTLDNFQEVARVDAILAKYNLTPKNYIGIRINPQIGYGKLSTYSVSKPHSKFGMPITEEYDDLISIYAARPYLTMVHVHAGSQSYDMEQIAIAIRRVVDLGLEINKRVGHQQITTFDIGGGIMTNFENELNTPNFHDWAAVLKRIVPELFTGQFHVITELGRRMLAKQGFIISQVEYVKTAGGRRVLLQHAGADIAVRTVYKPDSWPLRATCFNAKGEVIHPEPEKILDGSLLYCDIAGPCCIDDVLAPSLRPLPTVQQGDYIVLHDTGGYYHSAFSYYNMRQTPILYAFYEPEHWEEEASEYTIENTSGKDIPSTNGEVSFECIRRATTVEETMDFFTTQKT